jgi:hypothetical protein
MLLENLYRISLEKPNRWAMFIGLPTNTMLLLDVRVELLASYMMGFREASRLGGVDGSDTDAFYEWLREKNEFSSQGWATKYLNDCNGDHLEAIAKFWGFLHEYLLEKRPAWFVRLNAKPLPSQIINGAGTPKNSDIRNPEHIRAVAALDAGNVKGSQVKYQPEGNE